MSTEYLQGLIGLLNGPCQRWLEVAASHCKQRKQIEIRMEHFLLGVLDEPMSDFCILLRRLDVDAARMKKGAQRVLETFGAGGADDEPPVFDPKLCRLFERAFLIGGLHLDLKEVRSGSIFVALLENPEKYGKGPHLDLFHGAKIDTIIREFHDLLGGSMEAKARGGRGRESGPGDSPIVEGGALSKYATNFTELARNGRIDPVFGRDREIRQLVDILARRRKNNPIIVGDSGVGKTALVEGLAVRIVAGDVPDVLRDVALVGLDLGLLQAGAGVKGEFENRLKDVIEEVKNSETPIILFIDEAHTMIGAGGSQGGSDAANLLKPALARGELRTIAATTWSEYKKYFEKDAALSRRFQIIKVEEPGNKEATIMLRGLRDRYESAHNVIIRDDALVAAAELGSRYITGRQHPDKGVDLIDTAAARVRVALTAKPAELEDEERKVETLDRELTAVRRDAENCAMPVEERIAELEAEIEEAKVRAAELHVEWERERGAADEVLTARKALTELKKKREDDAKNPPPPPKDEPLDPRIAALNRKLQSLEDFKDEYSPDDYERRRTDYLSQIAALSVREVSGRDLEMEAARETLIQSLARLRLVQGKDPMVNVEVTPEVIARVIADWTGIPLGKMVRDEAQSLLTLENELQTRIKGQDHALVMVAEAVRAAKAGLKREEVPIGVFLFVGPSGVGKTETALGVADLLFGGERFMTIINMSEFQEKHTVSKLVGSPPGYVGYGEGGVLTEAVRQRPYSVVLLDEVEKSHPEVLNLFYQVFDKGMLADGEGRVVDFKDTVIFLTSNLASDIIMKACSGPELPDVEDLVAQIRPVLSAHFKPALLARMTIVPYYPIGASVMADIVRLKLKSLGRRLMKSHKMELVLSDHVIRGIASLCTEAETGARNIDQLMNQALLPRISQKILTQMADGALPKQLVVGIDAEGYFTFEFSNGEATGA